MKYGLLLPCQVVFFVDSIGDRLYIICPEKAWGTVIRQLAGAVYLLEVQHVLGFFAGSGLI